MKLLVTGGSGFIGTNLIEVLRTKGYEILNLDIKEPIVEEQRPCFVRGDIMDPEGLACIFQRFQPDAVLHLAAQACIYPPDDPDKFFAPNTVGTQNVLDAVKKTPSVKRVIVTSTQYVCQPGYTPKNADDYSPHTVYGQTKVKTEKITKAANLQCIWTIIRPTNIWGPWSYIYRNSIIKAIEQNLYIHPSGPPAIQGFGYVKNFALKIDKLLHADPTLVSGKTLYFGDELIPLYDWANGFSREIKGRNVLKFPRSLIYLMARFGDLYGAITKRQFVIFSGRYRNMVDNYIVPMEPTFQILGKPEISLAEAIKETVAWAKTHPPK